MLTFDHIQQTVAAYFKDKPVEKVWLFGSYARGEATEESDVDLLVELDYDKPVGWQFFGWHEELKDVLARKVDVVSEQGLNRHLAPFIHQDKKLLYAA